MDRLAPRPTDRASSTPSSTSVGRNVPLVLTGVVTALLLIPIWTVVVPPLNDYPNHLARTYIFAHLHENPFFQRMFELKFVVVPNLAIDIIATALQRIVPVYDAGRIFLTLVLVLWIVGPVLLHQALYKRLSLWPLAAGFVAYNACFQWGFANYLFSTGLAFVVLAAWIKSEQLRPTTRLAIFSLLATALFLSHLLGLAVYGLCVFGYECRSLPALFRKPTSAWIQQWLPAAGQFVVPALLFVFVSPSGRHFSGAALADLEIHITFLSRFIYSLRSPTWMELGIVDYAAFAFLGAVIALGFLTRQLVVHRAFVPVLICVGIPTAALLFFRYSFDDLLLYVRLPPIFAVLLIAGTSWRTERFPKLLAATVGIGALLFVARLGFMTDRWLYYDHQYAEFRQALASVPRGSAVFEVMVHEPVMRPPRLHGNPEYPYEFMTELATIERSAFSALLFNFHELEELRMTPAYRPISAGEQDPLEWEQLASHAAAGGPAAHFQDGWPAHFDYVVAIDPAGRDDSLAKWLTPVHRGSFFTLFRVVKPGEIPAKGSGS